MAGSRRHISGAGGGAFRTPVSTPGAPPSPTLAQLSRRFGERPVLQPEKVCGVLTQHQRGVRGRGQAGSSVFSVPCAQGDAPPPAAPALF